MSMIQKKQNAALDMAKFVFSLAVVMLHSGVLTDLLSPVYRLAVPFFFMTSSFFFFRKVNVPGADRKRIVKDFLRRNAVLYAVWFVILLPITLLVRGWLWEPFWTACGSFLKSLLFGGTFRASWFITANVVGILTVYALSRKVATGWCILLSVPVYVLLCLASNYYGLLQKMPLLIGAYQGYVGFTGSLVNSFPASFLWAALGKWFADREGSPSNRKAAWIVFVAGGVLLLGEFLLIKRNDWAISDDCYFMLVPTACGLFVLLKSSDFYAKNGKWLRNTSTIIYVSHASLVTVLSLLYQRFGLNGALMPVGVGVTTALLCLLFAWLVFELEKRKSLKWLRFLY